MVAPLLVLQFLQSSDGGLDCDGRGGVVGPGTTSYCFHAGTTVPNAHSSSFHLGLQKIINFSYDQIKAFYITNIQVSNNTRKLELVYFVRLFMFFFSF